jgi:hypothetical protein
MNEYSSAPDYQMAKVITEILSCEGDDFSRAKENNSLQMLLKDFVEMKDFT